MLIFYLQLFLLILLLFLSGFFSGSETALFSLSKLQREKIRQFKPQSGQRINHLLERPRQLIITILLGNEFVNISISSISAGIIIRLLGQETPWVNIYIIVPLLLLLGEITPKTLAINHSENFSAIVAGPLGLFQKIITPVRWLIRNVADGIVNLIVKESVRTGSILTEDVVKTLVAEGEKEGVLDSVEKEFIHRIFDFGDTRLRDVMTPRSNLFCLPVDMALSDMIQEIKKNHYSAVPIYRDNRDNIVGIIFATDLIGLTAEELRDSAKTLQQKLRKPYFVPANKRADELFRTLQREKKSVAITLDEYGGVQGLVTMEDLLEEIFGEIGDEYEIADRSYEKLGPKTYRVDGTLTLEEFNRLFNTDIEYEGVETVGGLVLSLFGELPRPHATILYAELHFTVEKIQANRIKSILVKKR